jgi:membrane protease YdiL (CAAX protease family)
MGTTNGQTQPVSSQVSAAEHGEGLLIPPGSAKWTPTDIAIGLAVLLVWWGLCFFGRAWAAAVPSWLLVALMLVLPEVFLLCYPLLLARRRGMADAWRWPRARAVLREAAVSVPIVLAVLFLLSGADRGLRYLWPQAPSASDAWQRGLTSSTSPTLALVLVVATTLGPLSEEVFFRGFLHNALRARTSRVAAAILQSALFALLHGYGVLYSFAAFILGLILTAAYEWRRSLLTPIFIHAGYNLIVALMVVGLAIEEANAPILGVIGEDHPQGCYVKAVIPQTPADDAGIVSGDVITELNGQPVKGIAQLAGAVRMYQVGDAITVGISRKGAVIYVKVVLKRKPKLVP